MAERQAGSQALPRCLGGLFDDGVSDHELDPAEVEALFAPAEEPEIESYGDDERLEAMIAGWLDPTG